MTKTAFVLMALVLGCTKGPASPAALDPEGNDWCAGCRMVVSDARFAGQLVVPGEEPKFFDDLGCLRRYLADHPGLPEGAVAFVADHRTKQWVPARAATYTRVPELQTPMASHLIAHADAASRDADPVAKTGTPVAAAEFLGGPVLQGATR